MYSKKLDHNDNDKPLSHLYLSKTVPPAHEFKYTWYRSKEKQETCHSVTCPRRGSYSPLEWSKYKIRGGWSRRLEKGADHGAEVTSVMCVDNRRSCFGKRFCNEDCFVKGWRESGAVAPGVHKKKGEQDEQEGNNKSPQNSPALGPSSPAPKVYSHIANVDTDEWEMVAQTQGDPASASAASFSPPPDVVGHKLLLLAEAVVAGKDTVLMSRVSKTELCLSAPPSPPKRQLVTAKNIPSAGFRFRAVTYNILAEIYATGSMYPYCDYYALQWDYRFQNIKRELMSIDGDVISLQEVQSDYFTSHVQPFFNELGYDGQFKQKTRDAMGIAGKVDGCAMFWKRSKLQVVEAYSIEFNELAQRQAESLGMNSKNPATTHYINRLKKDNIAQIVVLEFIQQSTRSAANQHSRICVVNTHLLANKEHPDIKLWQAWQLVSQVEEYALSRNLPVMICGDLNSTPDSAVYDLLAAQTVHPGHPDLQVNETEGKQRVLPDPRNITHSLSLASAYQTVMGDEPEFTNYTGGFRGTLDYIWYSADTLRPLSTAPIHSEEMIHEYGIALPNTQFSSDHILMMADMQLGGPARG
ncbi:hypothetical protein TL16_g00359 [Triparma laevis f. inornata]|nr:hypothetical protein TL16_g00359 [Triparma laevis f. inornata]